MITKGGTYRAKAKGGGHTVAGTGTEQVRVSFELVSDGSKIDTFLALSEKAALNSLKAMRTAGWTNEPNVFEPQFDGRDVDLVIEMEEYQSKLRPKVKWVNEPGRAAPTSNLDADARQGVLARVQATLEALGGPALAKAGPAPVVPAGESGQHQATGTDEIPF